MLSLPPYSWIWNQPGTTIAIGGLKAYGQDLREFGCAIQVAVELSGCGPLAGARPYLIPVFHAKLDDVNKPVLGQEAEVQRAVGLLRGAVVKGRPVLVTCAEGRNRSSLVVAEYLIQSGAKPRLVVETIKAGRAHTLTNPHFVAWLFRRRRRA